MEGGSVEGYQKGRRLGRQTLRTSQGPSHAAAVQGRRAAPHRCPCLAAAALPCPPATPQSPGAELTAPAARRRHGRGPQGQASSGQGEGERRGLRRGKGCRQPEHQEMPPVLNTACRGSSLMNLPPLFLSGTWSPSVRLHYTAYSTRLPIRSGAQVRLGPRRPQPASHPPPLRLLPAGPHPTVLTLYSLLQGGCLTSPWFPVPVGPLPGTPALAPGITQILSVLQGAFSRSLTTAVPPPAGVLHLAFDTRALSNLEPAQGEHATRDCGINEFTLQGLAPLPCL